MMRYELRNPNFKKSMIFVKIRGSFNPRLRGSKKDEIEDFCFFGKAGLKGFLTRLTGLTGFSRAEGDAVSVVELPSII